MTAGQLVFYSDFELPAYDRLVREQRVAPKEPLDPAHPPRHGDDDRDGLADVADAIGRKRRLQIRGVSGFPALPDRNRRDRAQIARGQARDDTGMSARAADVDVREPRVRVRAPDDDRVEHAGAHDVVPRLGAAAGSSVAQVTATVAPAALRAATEYAAALRKRYGDAVLAVRLFGSYARGEATEDSDVDVAVVLSTMDARRHREVIDLATDIGLPLGLVVSPMAFDESTYRDQEYRDKLGGYYGPGM